MACQGCARASSNVIHLSAQALELMRLLLGSEMAAVVRLVEPPNLVLEVLRASFAHAESVLEQRLRSRQIVLRHLEGKLRETGTHLPK